MQAQHRLNPYALPHSPSCIHTHTHTLSLSLPQRQWDNNHISAPCLLIHAFSIQECSLGIITFSFLSQTHVQSLLQTKPTPSHTPANARTSPVVPALKPSYSQVTRLGIRAHDPGKQHVIRAHDLPRDLQVLWGSCDPRARDPVKKTGDLLGDWSTTRLSDHRYMMHPLNHPVGTTNRGVRINKVIQLRIIGT